MRADQPFDATQRWIKLQIPGGQMNLSLEADDVEATVRVERPGVDFVQPATKEPWGTFAIPRDSEGNQMVISSRR